MIFPTTPFPTPAMLTRYLSRHKERTKGKGKPSWHPPIQSCPSRMTWRSFSLLPVLPLQMHSPFPAQTQTKIGSATAARPETTPRVFTELPLMVGSDFESDSGTMSPVIRTQTQVTATGSLVSIPLVSLVPIGTNISRSSHAGPNWIEAPCVRGIWGQHVSDLGFKRSCQREQANQIRQLPW